MNFPLMIKQVRKELKESQSTFGKRFGVTHATVSYWERGFNEAPYTVIQFVLDYLGIHEEREVK